ncbi:winged helix DNA-binding protein [Microvirga tunisiensis]|uniref:Winged helix DNA-binding protein n=2 Tax=Pannonibacter tanglangensis TaxID=2750084 RepID=A0A7X5EZG9_9HYPH|nr:MULTISPECIES: winged helix DNA-binding protein [unclassified Pannonibacter]NBN63352.1 winged helix DNA-binding protein [Pannonibacter sp. XCT-34]NBN76987.1 winged helix DNA-binding protein [Pannonibacter sp. XCT-53]
MTQDDDKPDLPPIGPIVSASHLASGAMPALSEIEFAVTMMVNAYQRWMVRCMAAAGVPAMSPLEVQVLHQVNHRGREKTLADVCLVLNIEDTHTVTYALKKLEQAGLIVSGRRGKEKTASITREGERACLEYRRLREALLVQPVKSIGLDEQELSRLAAALRTISGNYEQAARAAAAM